MKKSRIIKRLLAIVCAALFAMSLFPAAASDTAVPTIRVSDAEVSQGSTAYIYVYAENVTALSALQLIISYDENAFSLNTVNTYAMQYASCNTDTPGEISYMGMSNTGMTTQIVQLMRISLRALPGCEAGKYTIGLSVGHAIDQSGANVTMAKVSGSVTVKKTESQPLAGSFSAAMSPSTVDAGDSVSFTLSSYRLQGMAAGQFSFTYDSDLLIFKEASLLYGLNAEGCIFSVNDANPGNITVMWVNTQSAKSGELMKLTFKAAETAKGQAQVTCTPLTMRNANDIPIVAAAVSANVTIKEKVIIETKPAFYVSVPAELPTNGDITLTAIIEGRSKLAAADFEVTYDTAVLECVSVNEVENIKSPAGTMITPNFKDGRIKFSLFCESGSISEDTRLVDIVFKAKENVSQSTTLKTAVYDPVDETLSRVSVSAEESELQIIVPEFTVTFYDHDGALLKEESVPYLGAASAPEVKGKEADDSYHYVFSHWDKDFSSVTAPLEIKAVYSPQGHDLITWEMTDEGTHESECTVCQKTVYEDHSWGKAEFKDILNHGYSCEKCGFEKAESHTWENEECTQCGHSDVYIVSTGEEQQLYYAAGEGCTVICAVYDGNKLIGVNALVYTSEGVSFTKPEGMSVRLFFLGGTLENSGLIPKREHIVL